MANGTVTISRQEYLRLKEREEADEMVLNQIAASLEDIKAGRIKRVL